MKSVFIEKSKRPTDADLKKALGKNHPYWEELADFAKKSYPAAKGEWHFSGDKYGWSFRISDKKRVIVYLLPREGFFKTALVFGQKATDVVLESKVDHSIKKMLSEAKVYAEGRGIRLEVKDKSLLADIKNLITIKLAH